nr:MAG TPA: hypothetical protein [Caudoviricetes sp.]
MAPSRMMSEPAETSSMGVGLVGWWGYITLFFLSRVLWGLFGGRSVAALGGCLGGLLEGVVEAAEGVCGAVGGVGRLSAAGVEGDPSVLDGDLGAGGELGVGDDVPGCDPGDGGCVHGGSFRGGGAGRGAPPRSGGSEGVEGICVEAAHDGQPVAEVGVEVSVGGPVVGEALLVDVLEGQLVADGERPASEVVAGRVGAGGGVQLGGLQGGGGVGGHVRFLSVC